MKRRLVLRRRDWWVCFHATNSAFVSCIQTGITPVSCRKFDKESQTWEVWWEKLPELVSLAKRFYQVDWSELPSSWQMLIVGGKTRTQRRKPITVVTPHSKLFLTDGAPVSVVKAAYQALLSEYHPDHNGGEGDRERLKEVISAYREILSKKP
jgi:hypothetical protein